MRRSGFQFFTRRQKAGQLGMIEKHVYVSTDVRAMPVSRIHDRTEQKRAKRGEGDISTGILPKTQDSSSHQCQGCYEINSFVYIIADCPPVHEDLP